MKKVLKIFSFMLTFMVIIGTSSVNGDALSEHYTVFNVSGKSYEVPSADLRDSRNILQLSRNLKKGEYTYDNSKKGKIKSSIFKKGSYWVNSGKIVKTKVKGKTVYFQVMQRVKRVKVKHQDYYTYVLDKETKYDDVLIRNDIKAFRIRDNGQVIGTGYQNSKKYGLSPKTFNKTGALSGGKKKLLSALKNKKVTSITTKYKNIDVSV